MDNFMIQLADKIKAQDMIRANTSAEVEEMGHIKEQMDALQHSIEQAQNTLDRMQATMEGIAAQKVQASMPEERSVQNDEDVIYILEEEITQQGKDIRAEFEGLRNLLAEMRSEVANAEGREVYDAREDVRQIQTSLAALGEQVEKYDDTLKLEEVKTLLSDALTDLKDLESLVLDVSERVETMNRDANNADRGSDAEAMFSALTEIREQLTDLSNLQGTIREEQGAIHEGQKSFQEEQQTIHEGQSALREEQSALREEFGAQRENLETVRDDLVIVRDGMQALRTGIDGKDEELLNEIKVELSRLDEHLSNVGASANSKNTEGVEAIKRFLREELEKLQKTDEQEEDSKKEAEEIKVLLEEFKAGREEENKQLEDRLTGMHEGLREGYHKECVKVYRNVQAAFGEENQRQTVQIEDAVGKLAGKSKLAMIFSLLAFGMGLVSVVLQVLSILKVF